MKSNARNSPNSLLKIEMDFEKEIARIMPDMALSETGKSLEYQLI
jgi:hypothetical protein